MSLSTQTHSCLHRLYASRDSRGTNSKQDVRHAYTKQLTSMFDITELYQIVCISIYKLNSILLHVYIKIASISITESD